MSLSYLYQIENHRSPFWAFAIHDGHHIDADLEPYLHISPEDRLREEDPYTAILAELPFSRFVCGTSRFQLDLNRNKDGAIYLTPEQSWGIQVWRIALPQHIKDKLYESYDMLYRKITQQIQHTIDRYGYFVVYDIHSYNALRDGPTAMIDKVNNPQINIGTANNHSKWQELTSALMDGLRTGKDGQTYDVRENVKFKGGFLSSYLNEQFGDYGCVFSIEFRKDFMNEWTGEVYPQKLQEYKQLLMQTIDSLESYFAYER